MQGKGLTVSNEQNAESFLENVGYFRFKIYLWSFFDSTQSSYETGSTFEQGIELYRFDEALRNFLFSVICRVEIKLRSKLDQVITAHTNNPFWYLDDNLFIPSKLYSIDGIRANLASSFQQSKDSFSEHFKKHYFNASNVHFKQLPPFWVISELATFGQIKTLYSSLNKALFQGVQNKNKLNTLAHDFGAKNFKELNSWIIAIRDVRNRCAHHARVWNANHRQASGIVNKLGIEFRPENANKIYLFCILLNLINDQLGMGFRVKETLQNLFLTYPTAQIKASSAGFPPDWISDPFWN